MNRYLRFIEHQLEGTPYLKYVVWFLITVIVVWLLIRIYRWLTQLKLRWLWPRKTATSIWQRLKQMALDFKNAWGPRDWYYDTPWYFLLNSEAPDKSAFAELKACNRMLSFLGKTTKDPLLKSWLFFDGGVLIPSNNEKLSRTLDKVNQLRSERPVDGIIVDFSAKQLLAHSTSWESAAENTYDQLWKIQKTLGFMLPVYVVISDCEELNGFTEFSSAFSKQHDQIWGWSSDANLDAIFQKEIVVNNIALMENRIRKIQLSAMSDDDTSNDEFFLFPAEFKKLSGITQKVITKLFYKNSLSSLLHLRGCYFTGKDTVPVLGKSEPPEPLFLNDLLTDKVFPELNIASPVRQRWLASKTVLRRLQYLSIVLIAALVIRMGVESQMLNEQVSNISNALTAVNVIKKSSQANNGTGVHELTEIEFNSLIDQISSMNAHKLDKATIPSSWYNSYNLELRNYFKKDIFGNLLIPTLDHRLSAIRHSLAQDLENIGFISDGYSSSLSDWLQRYVDFGKHRQIFTALVTTEATTIEQKEKQLQDFVLLSEYLMGISPPPSFTRNSELYRDALAKYVGETQLANVQQDNFISQPLPKILQKVTQHLVRQQRSVNEFFDQLRKIQNLPVATRWYDRKKDLVSPYSDFSDWFSNLKQDWLSNLPPCKKLQKQLKETFSESKLGRQLRFEVNNFASDCQEKIEQALLSHNDALGFTAFTLRTEQQLTEANAIAEAVEEGSMEGAAKGLVHKIEKPFFNVTSQGKKLFNSLENLSQLSFINVIAAGDVGKDKLDYFWSVSELQQAIKAFKEYENFAVNNFTSLPLPAKEYSDPALYLSQAVALKQLQQTIFNFISGARQTRPKAWVSQYIRPLEEKEAKLAAQVEYFRQSIDTLLELNGILEQLGFAQTNQWLQQESRAYAVEMLEKVNRLSTSSRVYMPYAKPTWGRHNFTQALFGIQTDSEIPDYLESQYARVHHLASNYAEPLVLYLLNTDQGSGNLKISSLNRWRMTLEQINRKQNKDPTNNASRLEDYFNGQLTGLNQSNCFEKMKSAEFITASDVFASALNEISQRVFKHCQGFRKDIIKKQYRNLANQFNKLLANQYPFTQLDNATPATPARLKKFFDLYNEVGDGLTSRLKLVAVKEARYERALAFARELEKAAGFFNPLMASLETGQEPQIKIATKFNPMSRQNQFAKHIKGWTLRSGTQSVIFPGAEETVDWSPGEQFSVEINWANGSPYAPPGKKSQLKFKSKEYWSLIHMIEKNRSANGDHSGLTASDLLEFDISLEGRKAPAKETASAFVRFNLSVFDAETKTLVPLVLPSEFPTVAPVL
ncbi:type VI secretion system protein [Aliikangiella coralliicola]|uniref:Type VI secretion system component TssM1 N-terminal domain-containing protein n=1 Tax=Aliikangiella coralliicola TaxID=2592383 RepID=A0A545UCR4_9GAMM|nr:type VI secretion system protein [Aliikangiella coralliicola]TQV87259.1 hypothetical protein FLL46_12455 [Aliikangiella coralliicola]